MPPLSGNRLKSSSPETDTKVEISCEAQSGMFLANLPFKEVKNSRFDRGLWRRKSSFSGWRRKTEKGSIGIEVILSHTSKQEKEGLAVIFTYRTVEYSKPRIFFHC